ncbi:aminoglycoside phosphotransferase family protein [Mumia sp. Pv 4-285]|uniref:aminoglycoside phosphotransferase family protein n=1 Tax=Mumia qirimensis TaxID=3234852 RepID=UPI00351CDD8F
MSPIPPAEIDVTADLVRGLLASQHPDLAELPLEVVAHGWDNEVLRLGDDLALRMPRRELGARLVRHEQEWLPALAPQLPVRTPVPVRVGSPSDGTRGPAYPWWWSIVPWFDGQMVARTPVAERRTLARPLAQFVTALHRTAPPDAPVNPYRGVPLAARDADFRERLAAHPLPEQDALLDLWERLISTPVWDGPALWVHGDLHPANLLAAPENAGRLGLSAVIDFGDITSGDPASDLATAWLTFDAEGRGEFRELVSRAGVADGAMWDRAHAWAVVFSVLLTTTSDDVPHLHAVGVHGLAQVLAGE